MSDRGKSDLGLVRIVRRKGRIAGYSQPPVPTDLLWAGTNRPRKKFGRRANGWAFPPAVRELLLQECQGKTVLHLFGGVADFGYRLDLDPEVNPDKVGDAYLAHTYFDRSSFEDVVIDPPYTRMTKQEILALIDTASWIATRYVWWFHTVQIATHRVTPLDRQWMVPCGAQCAVRILQRFRVTEPKRRPPEMKQFTRGHPLMYNRWDKRNSRAAADLFPEFAPAPEHFASKHLPAGKQNNGVWLGDWE